MSAITKGFVFGHAASAKRDCRATGKVEISSLSVFNDEVSRDSKGAVGIADYDSWLVHLSSPLDVTILIPEAGVAGNHHHTGLRDGEASPVLFKVITDLHAWRNVNVLIDNHFF